PRGACAAAASRPIGTADSTNIRSSQITGDDEPRPGISTFQRMFFVSLHSAGGVADRETPVANGPRHCGQKRSAAGSGAAWIVTMTAASAAGKNRIRAALTPVLLSVTYVGHRFSRATVAPLKRCPTYADEWKCSMTPWGV